eukprot:11475235-Heterocapsa_arctica.AAC.1
MPQRTLTRAYSKSLASWHQLPTAGLPLRAPQQKHTCPSKATGKLSVGGCPGPESTLPPASRNNWSASYT